MKKELFISILSALAPICSVAVMCFIEKETAEAILGGLLAGCLIGSVLGGIALGMNKSNSKIVQILSTLPMIPLALYLLMLIPYLINK